MKPERLLKNFENLVMVNSPSGSEGPLVPVVRSMLQGIPLEEIHHLTADGQDTHSLLFRWSASPECQHLPGILLSSHLDTVEATEGLQLQSDAERYATSGTTILGADDKSGIAIIIEALQSLHEASLPHPAIEVLFTEQEEIGLLGSKRLKNGLLQSQQGLILDSDGSAGCIIHAAPFQMNFKVKITGVPAHAGTEPEKGKSAILAAAKVIPSLPFGRIDENTTLNVGKIQGGKASNIVAEHCMVEGEIRSLVRDKLEMLEHYVQQSFEQLTPQGYQIEYKATLTYHGFHQATDSPFIQKLQKSALSSGIQPILKKSGGGSDANVLKGLMPQLECVVLSTGMQNVHTHKEWIAKKDLIDSTQWLINFLQCSST
ncbi:MAG TPA: M20/M25/M40 family metallo-hydrolase [Caldisericia bacterium]|nr:M20/M25/M40 family metallo-hydrolase [Caldisericia bacterium]